eukprot:599434-Rhodomonas_salina.1
MVLVRDHCSRRRRREQPEDLDLPLRRHRQLHWSVTARDSVEALHSADCLSLMRQRRSLPLKRSPGRVNIAPVESGVRGWRISRYTTRNLNA